LVSRDSPEEETTTNFLAKYAKKQRGTRLTKYALADILHGFAVRLLFPSICFHCGILSWLSESRRN
jgi:hypothetical protein